MSNIYKYKSIDFAFKDVDVKQGIVTGYFASFNTVDAEKDVILPGAFTKSIKDNFNRIKHLLDHNIQKAVGKIQVLDQDTKGLYYESKAGKHAMGQDFILMAESGIITEHSFGYQIPKGKSTVSGGVRTISEVTMYEGSSLQSWGMNENTPLTGVKAFYKDAEQVEQRIKTLDKFCRNSEATDETIELLLIEIKQLNQVIINLSDDSTQAVAETLEPVKEKAINAGLVLAYLSL